jgi:methylated-DNA-[protein]-cysteine S-methyltransferase
MKDRRIVISKDRRAAPGVNNPLFSGFAAKVYRAVLSIPFGQVRSYKWVAKKCGSPGSSRAVGQALKHNPYPLIIPCHRVVKSNRQIGGYSLGLAQKKFLLCLEKELAACMLSKK